MMSDKEKIRARIEGEMGDITYGAGKPKGVYDFCKELLSFIDSLPEETDDGLEEAAEKYEQEHTIQRYDGGGFTPDSTVGIGEAFIAGAEWQKERMMDVWLKDRDGCFWDGVEEGKKAMEKQMMEEAVEAEVADLNGELYNRCVECGLTDLDKVKIIIVKEDKQ